MFLCLTNQYFWSWNLIDFNFKNIDWSDILNKSESVGGTNKSWYTLWMITVWNNWCTSLPEKKHIGFITHFIHSPDKLSDHDIVAGTLKVVIHHHKETSEKRKVTMNLWGNMYLHLQRKSISTVIQILAQYRSTLTWFSLLFKIRRINTSHPKLVVRSLRFLGLHRKKEWRFAEETKLVQKQKRQTVRNSDQNLKLWEKKLRMMLGSSMTCLYVNNLDGDVNPRDFWCTNVHQ